MSDNRKFPVTGKDVSAALRLRTLLAEAAADPDLTRDALLLVMVGYTLLVTSPRSGRTFIEWADAVAAAAGQRDWWVRHTIAADVPRYEPAHSPVYRCVAPMVRREGECGQPGRPLAFYDPDTGERHWSAACSRHRPDVERRALATRDAWRANGQPEPAANTGGVLPRYLHHQGWAAVYHWAAPWRTAKEAPPPTPPRPHLILIRGEMS